MWPLSKVREPWTSDFKNVLYFDIVYILIHNGNQTSNNKKAILLSKHSAWKKNNEAQEQQK